jgi:hydroxyacylglutathione hydrolase/adenylyltransferase/sulfurtransferase
MTHPLSDPEIEVTPAHTAEVLADDSATVIDVRETYEHEAGHIAGARHIELERLASKAETIERDRPVIFLCRLGSRSLMAAQAFRRAGFDAYSMAGGITAWDAQGLALEPEGGHVADH